MGAKSKYVIENFYQGGYSTFKPYSSAEYFTVGKFGETTDPRSANVLKEVSDKLSSGTKNIEIEGVSPEIFDAIPKQHLKEVNRLSKLTGVNVSVHGPVINTAGVTQSGVSEADRKISERKVLQTLERSHEINPDGTIMVNFHSAEGIPGSEPLSKGGYKKIIAINKQTGRMIPLEQEKDFFPDRRELKPEIEEKIERGELSMREVTPKDFVIKPLGEGRIKTPEERLEILNATEWDNSLSQMLFNKERADEILNRNRPLVENLFQELEKNKYKVRDLPEPQQKVYREVQIVKGYLSDIHKQVNNLFSKAYEYGNPEQKEALKEISENFSQELAQNPNNIFVQAKAMEDLMIQLRSPILAPNLNVKIEEYVLEKSSQTYGNAAFDAFKKFKDKTPTLVIENPPAGFALSTGEDIKNIVVASRNQFVNNATKPRDQGGLGMSEGSAKEAAEKFIGATWDVGHINMMRKYGYSDKEILEEAKKVAPYIKHVHLSDNFGFEHTELPMGMGNVPLKETMEILGKKGEDAKKIIEAGQWWQHFKVSPFHTTLELVGSPMYSTRTAPYWNQTPGFYQGYYGGFGQFLPDVNYQTFGAGFSQLPVELGGQKQGTGGRMSGRPME